MAQRRSPLESAQLLDLGAQALAPFLPRGGRVETPEIQLVDDGQHVDLEGHHMNLRAVGDDLQLRAVRPRGDEFALEVKDAQEVDEVRAHEPQAAQVGQIVGLKLQRAQVVELLVDLVDQFGQRVRRLVAAHEGVFGPGLRVPMQHGLPHRELVQIGVEQVVDDRLHRVSHAVERLRESRRQRSASWR